MRWPAAILGLSLALSDTPSFPGIDSGAPPDALAACAAFASDGSSATATVGSSKLSLEISDAVGKSSQLSLSLRYPHPNEPARSGSFSCKAHFDHASDLVAIGVSEGFPMRRLQVGVADAKQPKWIGDWVVEPASGIYQPSLAGFLQATTSVVIGGEPSTKDGRGIHHGSFWTLVFDSSGQQLGSANIRNYGPDTDVFPVYADTDHNRLWFFPCDVVSAAWSRQPDCPIGWVSLTGAPSLASEFQPRTPSEKRTDFWMYPATFAVPDLNTVLIAENVIGVNTVWLVDTFNHTLDRLSLPKRLHFPRFEGIHGIAFSPDGEVAALPLVEEAVAFPYIADNYVYKGTDFAVVQLHPLRVLGMVLGAGGKSFTSSAIDHRQGQVSVLVYRKNGWERTALKTVPGRDAK